MYTGVPHSRSINRDGRHPIRRAIRQHGKNYACVCVFFRVVVGVCVSDRDKETKINSKLLGSVVCKISLTMGMVLSMRDFMC